MNYSSMQRFDNSEMAHAAVGFRQKQRRAFRKKQTQGSIVDGDGKTPEPVLPADLLALLHASRSVGNCNFAHPPTLPSNLRGKFGLKREPIFLQIQLI